MAWQTSGGNTLTDLTGARGKEPTVTAVVAAEAAVGSVKWHQLEIAQVVGRDTTAALEHLSAARCSLVAVAVE